MLAEKKKAKLVTVVKNQNTSVPLSFFQGVFAQRVRRQSLPCKRQLRQLQARRQ